MASITPVPSARSFCFLLLCRWFIWVFGSCYSLVRFTTSSNTKVIWHKIGAQLDFNLDSWLFFHFNILLYMESRAFFSNLFLRKLFYNDISTGNDFVKAKPTPTYIKVQNKIAEGTASKLNYYNSSTKQGYVMISLHEKLCWQ